MYVGNASTRPVRYYICVLQWFLWKGSPMKYLLLVIVFAFVLFPSASLSQIPNPGFETWTSGSPDNWFVNNIPDYATPVTQSATANSGSSALRGEVVNTVGGPIQPLAQSGADAAGFTVTERHATLSGYYQFSPLDGDRFSVNCAMFKDGNAVGLGAVAITAAAGTYTQFNATIDYFASDVPDSCIIQFQIIGPITGDDFHVGSWVLIDDLSFSGIATAVEDPSGSLPQGFSLSQNFPNPFNPSTTIYFEIPKAGFVSLNVYDVLGRSVGTLASESLEAGRHKRVWNAENLSAGIYFYRLQSGGVVQTRRLTLVK